MPHVESDCINFYDITSLWWQFSRKVFSNFSRINSNHASPGRAGILGGSTCTNFYIVGRCSAMAQSRLNWKIFTWRNSQLKIINLRALMPFWLCYKRRRSFARNHRYVAECEGINKRAHKTLSRRSNFTFHARNSIDPFTVGLQFNGTRQTMTLALSCWDDYNLSGSIFKFEF